MKKRFLIGLVLGMCMVLILGFFSSCGDIEKPHKTAVVSEKAPVTYTVVKGDCLWKIADRELQDKNLWPLIWWKNKDVIGENPDLIYPGQVFEMPDKTMIEEKGEKARDYSEARRRTWPNV